MKIIFDKKEDMDYFIEKLFDLNKISCIALLINPPMLERCSKYDDCLQCFKDHGIVLTYVKNCTECAKTSVCTAYYRNDLISGLGTCSPIPK